MTKSKNLVSRNKILTKGYLDMVSSKQRQTKKQRFKSEPQRRTAEFMEDGLIELDNELKITSIDRGAEKMYGFYRREIVGKKLDILFPDFSSRQLVDIKKKLSEGAQLKRSEVIMVTKIGRYVRVLLTSAPIVTAEENMVGTVLYIRDITQKRAIEETQKFLEKVREVLAMPYGTISILKKVGKLTIPQLADACAIHTLTKENNIRLTVLARADGVHVFSNKQSNDCVLVSNIKGPALVARTHKPKIYHTIKDEDLRGYSCNNHEFEMLKTLEIKSALVVPILTRQNIYGTISFLSTWAENDYNRDDLPLAKELARKVGTMMENSALHEKTQEEIRNHLVTEKKLEESNKKMELFLESTSDAFFSIDKQFRYTYLNHNALQYAEKSKEELIGKSMTEVFPNSAKSFFYKKYQEVMRKGRPIEFEDFIKGEWFEVRAYPHKDGLSVYYRDITDRKQLEQRKDEFISMASHELKTPLTSVALYAELLGKISLPEKGKKYLVNLSEQVKKLDKLTNDLLDLSKMQVGKIAFEKEVIDLCSLLKNTVETFKTITKTHEIKLFMSRKPAYICGDKNRIEQVVTNILNNAVKYSPNANKIIVRASCSGNPKGFATISVEDFGVGVSPESRKKIFGRFYQGASADGYTFPGLGLGLYISKTIIDKHKGKIEVDSAVGKGSIFKISLPVINKNDEC